MSEIDLKDKSKQRSRQSSIDFVVPMQLEACVYHMEQASKNDTLHIAVIEGEDDCAKFTAHLYQKTHLVFSGEGTMRRWAGTSTRFEGKGSSDDENVYRFPLILLTTTVNLGWIVVLIGAMVVFQGSIICLGTALYITVCFINVFITKWLNYFLQYRTFKRLMREILVLA